MPKPKHNTRYAIEEDDRFYKMLARFDGRCECGEELEKGKLIVFDSGEKKAYCTECGENFL